MYLFEFVAQLPIINLERYHKFSGIVLQFLFESSFRSKNF